MPKPSSNRVPPAGRAIAFALGLSLALPGLAAAQDHLGAALPREMEQTLKAAVDSGSPAVLQATVIALIAGRPDLVSNIVERAQTMAPEQAGDLRKAVGKRYPAMVAQLPPPPPPAPSKGPAAPPEQAKLEREVELGGSYATGNAETASIDLAGRLHYKSPIWEHKFEITYDFGRRDGDTAIQRLTADYEPRYNVSERHYYFGFLEYEDDRFSGFDYTVSEGAGPGYRVFDREDLMLNVQAGPGLRHTRESATGQQRTEPIGRGAAEFRWKISDTTEFSNDTTVTAGTERTLSQNMTALKMQVIERLSAKLSYEVRHNSNPPPDTTAVDTLAKVTLLYEF
ncbi:MAG TPA: DUF481 domain-containing protein [Alphaproteobacteria bacterium]|jgi:putative salt-induced outer membrane protein|nr:DUF481 domain-containing protein [Alphaproteobacteria bacterium]